MSPAEAKKIKEADNYTNYVILANKRIKSLVNKIQSNSKEPPIIIIQADEGFTPNAVKSNGPQGSYWYGASKKDLRLHMRILNAYFLPGVNAEEVLYESISPVNTFRLVFNLYFGTKYDLLSDESFSMRPEKPHKFFPITDIVNY